jgi:hypothetical protein
MRLGAMDYIAKPFRRKELLGPVKRALRIEEDESGQPLARGRAPSGITPAALTPGDKVAIPNHAWAEFQQDRTYTIDMRLEYGIPTTTQEFISDFTSIHPKSYLAALDFSATSPMGQVKEARLRLGDETVAIPVEENNERHLESGHHLRLVREADYCSFITTIEGDMPYAHRHFPILSVA